MRCKLTEDEKKKLISGVVVLAREAQKFNKDARIPKAISDYSAALCDDNIFIMDAVVRGLILMVITEHMDIGVNKETIELFNLTSDLYIKYLQ